MESQGSHTLSGDGLYVVRWVGLEPTGSAPRIRTESQATADASDAVTQSSRSSRSALFTAYNCARSLVRQGRLDGARLNRALGLAQSKERERYFTTAERCSCKDFQYGHGRACKHMIAVALLEVAR